LWALVPQSAVQRMLDRNPHWWQHIAQLAEDNGEIACAGFADLTRQNSAHRAISVLLRLAGCREHGPEGGGPVTVGVSQSDLAAMAVMSRNTLNSVVKDLLAANLVQAAYRRITLTNPAALRAMLDRD
jgi:CRP-like cAMP-binding protein